MKRVLVRPRIGWESMRPNPRKYGPARRAIMTPLAGRYQLDYNLEVLQPGSRPEQIAFQLVCCGADLLSGLCDRDSVPTTNRKVARSVAKSVSRSFATDSGRHAATFLSQAMAHLMGETMAHNDQPESAAAHAKLGELIQKYFPLDSANRNRLEGLRSEYRVIDDHEIEGRFPATGWYMAMADPEFAKGRDPHTDPELLATQTRYASRYLRLGAERQAIAICLGERDFGVIEPSLLVPYEAGYEILEYDQPDLTSWLHCAEVWQEAGLRAVSADVV